MEQSKPIPEEISKLVFAERVRLYPARRHNGANSMKSLAFKGGAEFMYHRMAEEIEALRKDMRPEQALRVAAYIDQEILSLRTHLCATEAERDAIKQAFDEQAEELKKLRNQ